MFTEIVHHISQIWWPHTNICEKKNSLSAQKDSSGTFTVSLFKSGTGMR